MVLATFKKVEGVCIGGGGVSVVKVKVSAGSETEFWRKWRQKMKLSRIANILGIVRKETSKNVLERFGIDMERWYTCISKKGVAGTY